MIQHHLEPQTLSLDILHCGPPVRNFDLLEMNWNQDDSTSGFLHDSHSGPNQILEECLGNKKSGASQSVRGGALSLANLDFLEGVTVPQF